MIIIVVRLWSDVDIFIPQLESPASFTLRLWARVGGEHLWKVR